jgi:hypothetical protein
MVLLSTGFHLFVVYARTARPLVPLLCLLGGWAIFALTASRPNWRPAVMAVVSVAALLQFLPHFTRVFPREVEARVLAEVGNPKRTLSVTGSLYRPLQLPVNRPDLALVNAQMLYPVRSYVGFPAGQVVFSLPHPLSYPPYQYEGHTPRERRLLREHDIAIKLIRLADPGSLPDHPPAPFVFTAADRPDGLDHGRR